MLPKHFYIDKRRLRPSTNRSLAIFEYSGWKRHCNFNPLGVGCIYMHKLHLPFPAGCIYIYARFTSIAHLCLHWHSLSPSIVFLRFRSTLASYSLLITILAPAPIHKARRGSCLRVQLPFLKSLRVCYQPTAFTWTL